MSDVDNVDISNFQDFQYILSNVSFYANLSTMRGLLTKWH